MYKNSNSVVYAVAQRAKVLGDLPINALRMTNGYDCDDEDDAIKTMKAQRLTRGDLIEQILIEEFTVDFPQEFEQ